MSAISPDLFAVQDGSYIGYLSYLWDFVSTPGSLPSGAALTRASKKWTFASDGVLTERAVDEAAWDYNPVTLALRGLSVEPARTNYVSSQTGTGWSHTTGSGLSRTGGSGTDADNIPYVSSQWSGTASGATINQSVTTPLTDVVAALGETWTASAFARLGAGSLTNMTSVLQNITERNAAGSALGGSATSTSIAPTSSALRLQRNVTQRTLSNASVERVTSAAVQMQVANGLTVDGTFHMGAAQLEKGAGASSPIITTGSPTTRAADVLTLTMTAGIYDLDIILDSGRTRVVGADATGGSYVVPTSTSCLRYIRALRRI